MKSYVIFIAGFLCGVLLTSLVNASTQTKEEIVEAERAITEKIFHVKLDSSILFVENQNTNGAYYRNLGVITITNNLSSTQLPLTISHELCHEALHKINCRALEQSQNEKICDLYAYYRYPFRTFFESKDVLKKIPFLKVNCLDMFFCNYSKFCNNETRVKTEFFNTCGGIL